MSGALDGVKILGFTHFAQAPYALQLMGDMGAEIINIERPGIGDFNRAFLPQESLGGESPFFLAMNRNKRSLTLNLKHARAREIVHKLIRESDAVVTNFRTGTLERLGFGYETAKALNPKIVYCEAVGYGSTGPYAELPGQDLLAQCLTGYPLLVGPDQDGRPISGGPYVVDMYSAMALAVGLLGALYDALKTGEGQRVEVNLINSSLHLQAQEFSYYLNTGLLPERPKNHSGHILQEAPYGIYKTQDGWLCFSTNMVEHEEEKVNTLGEILGIENLRSIMPNKEVMMTDRDRIHDVLEAALVKRPTAYWVDAFQKVGFWCSRVNNYEEVARDPQVLHNGIIKEIEHPTAGVYKAVGAPFEMSKTPPEIRRPAPLLGQHTQEILHELGYTDAQVEELREQGVI